MVLRPVARTRTAGLARSIDRGPPCRPGAGDPERLHRSSARQRAPDPDQRSRRDAGRKPALRAGLQRQLRVRPRAIARGAARVMHLSNLPRKLGSAQVVIRFCLRLFILFIFAMFGTIGFGRSLAALLWMSTILSAVIGTMKREPPLDRALNHWDEMVAYAALCCLVSGFNQVALF